MNFVKLALEHGGTIKPLVIKPEDLTGPSITNPSVLIYNNKILVNLRNVNYTLYHSELNRFEHMWGPLSYIHPENDMHLRTTNHIVELNENLDIVYYSKIDTSKFDIYEPQWEFVGLEDVRLVEWNNKLYGIGVRRDLDTKGTGRMEISELEITETQVKEVSRYRIPGPPPDNEYPTSGSWITPATDTNTEEDEPTVKFKAKVVVLLSAVRVCFSNAPYAGVLAIYAIFYPTYLLITILVCHLQIRV